MPPSGICRVGTVGGFQRESNPYVVLVTVFQRDDDLARTRLKDVIEHLRILEADADAQNAWLHPCGWTRQEPFVHVADHKACAPINELWDSFDDMWPTWHDVLAPVLTAELQDRLNRLAAGFEGLDEAALLDELESLDRPPWAEIRRLATEALIVAVPIIGA